MHPSLFGARPRSVRRRWGRGVGLGLALMVLAVGCGRGSFIGRQYDNFTAYYNTFYNAREAFEKGVESVNKSVGTVDRARYISIFPDPTPSSGGASFEKAIQKSADLLRQHPKSKWVDDALLLIGRARYYQQNYVGAAQKFREVIALESGRAQEARFRLAQTLVAADRYTEAAEVLRAGLEGNETTADNSWTARLRLVRAELAVRREEWETAEAALERGLNGPLPPGAGARAAFLLGQVRETLGNFEEAQAAYERVLNYNPPYRLEFAARLSAIEMQGRHGAVNAALQRLEELERADDTKAMRGKIAITRARLYRELGRPEQAKQVLIRVLRGENAPTGTIQGRVHYDLATLYRDTYQDFTQAAAHFDTAATTLSTGDSRPGAKPPEESRLLPRAPSDASVQAERFRGLAQQAERVARMDSLLRLGEMPRSEFRAFLQKLRKKRMRKQKRKQQAKQQSRRQQQFRSGQRRTADQRRRTSAEQGTAVQTRGSDAGFLFHRDPTLVQQGRRQFRETWGNRPLVDNWRRLSAIQASATDSAKEKRNRPSTPTEQPVPTGTLVDVSAVPRDSASRAQMKKKLAVAQYELANALFRAAGRPDSAATWFRRILDEHEDHPVARQALYGLAQAHRAQGDTAAAEKAYRRLVEKYPGTPYARRAREQLGLQQENDSTGLAVSRADSAYARAYHTWQRGAPEKALSQFFSVAQQYSSTATARRALLAAGVVYRRATQRRETSRQLRVRFRRRVDSLTRAPGDSATTTPSVDTGTVRGPNPSRDSTTRDTTTRQDSLTSPTDTSTTGPEGPSKPLLAPRQRRDSVSGRPRQAAPDSARGDSVRMDSRERRVGSAGTSPQEPPARPSGRTVPSAPAPPKRDTTERDTTYGSVREVDSDSTRESSNVPSDSSGATTKAESSASPFKTLLVHLTETYAGTPVAKRAQSLLEYLNRSPGETDTLSSSSPTKAVQDRPSPSDSTGISGAKTRADSAASSPARAPEKHPPDTTQSPAETPRRPSVPDSSANNEPDSTAFPNKKPSPNPAPDTTQQTDLLSAGPFPEERAGWGRPSKTRLAA